MDTEKGTCRRGGRIMAQAKWECRDGEHLDGGESCAARGKGFALPVCKHPPRVAVLGAVRQTTRRASERSNVPHPAFLASFAVISARLRFVKCQLSKRNAFSVAISLAFQTFTAHFVRFSFLAPGPGCSRRWCPPSAGCPGRGAGPPAAAGGLRLSAGQPGTLAAGRLLSPPLSSALF